MELSSHDTQVLETFQREYNHFDRYRRDQATLQADLKTARGKTGAKGAWAKVVTIPHLKKKIAANDTELDARRVKLKFATENALYTVGRKALRDEAVAGQAGAILAQQAMSAFAVSRYFYKLSNLADAAEKKTTEAIGHPGQHSPVDYINGYGGSETVNRKSVSEDYRALMDAADYVRMFREHLYDAGASVQQSFKQVTAARTVHDAMSTLHSYSGSVDSMLMSARPEKAREELTSLRDAIRRIHDSFIREVVSAQAMYPGQSTKMNAAFLKALGSHTGDLPEDGQATLDSLRDAMREVGMQSVEAPRKKRAASMRV